MARGVHIATLQKKKQLLAEVHDLHRSQTVTTDNFLLMPW